MHDTKNRSRLYEAAEYTIGRLNHKVMDPRQTRGYLQILDVSTPDHPLLTAFVGTYNKSTNLSCHKDMLRNRFECILNFIEEGHDIPKYLTGSDLGFFGAVLVDELVFSFLSSKHSEDDQGDEAITLMIAMKAGLLGKRAVRTLRCVPGKAKFNPHLRLLMDNITWTK